MDITELLEKKEKKEEALKRLEQDLLVSENKIKRIYSIEKILEERVRFKKIIAAGKLFEKAGILNDYDEDELLQLLILYKTQKG